MKMPLEARHRFDQLLTKPLEKTNLHKREINALLQQIDAGPAPLPDARAAVRLAGILLERMERKTSPLYVRLTHAAARFVTEDVADPIDATDWTMRRDVLWSVAHSTKHFDLVGSTPD